MSPTAKGRSWRRALILLASCALAAGLFAAVFGRHDLARWMWAVGTVPVAASLAVAIARDLLAGRAGVDVIALLSMSAALALGEALAAVIVAVMYAGGSVIEDIAVGRAERDLKALIDRAPRTAHRRIDDRIEDIPIDDVAVGDLLLVRAGEVVPTDGLIVGPNALLDESAVTGEPLPVARRSGEAASSGTVNAGETFEMEATAASGDSTYAGIVELATAAQTAKAPFIRMADRYALLFLPVALLAAGAAWALSQDPIRGLAVLVAATPCPLILAAPAAFVAGASRAARRGILIKGGGPLEALARAHTVMFDKTGTLTVGGARLVAIETGPDRDANEALRLAASLEQASHHVVAAAIVAAASERGLSLHIPTEVRETFGTGIEGKVDGRDMRVGALQFVQGDEGLEDWAARAARRASWRSALTVFVSSNGRLIAVLLLADELRRETPRAIQALRDAGVGRIVMVTGDRADAAETIGAALDLDAVLADRIPSDKVDAVAIERRLHPTLMIGDGINDAPALAAADVGVAMGARGASASSEAADVVILVDRLDRVSEAVAIARRTRLIALQSIIAGMTLSFATMGAAAFGWIGPVGGALIQEAIDIAVILNALRALGGGSTLLRRPLPETATSALREDHEKIEQSLDRLRQIADALDAASPRRACEYIDEADRLVADVILAHERDDECDIYPRISHYLPNGQGLGAMSRAHREIRHQARLLARLAEGLPSHEPDKYLIRDAQRIIEAIETLVRVHNAQEEDVYEQAASEFSGSGSLREPQTRKSEAASTFDRAIGSSSGAQRVRRTAFATLAALAVLLGCGWLYFRSERDALQGGVTATGVIEAASATPISTRLSGTIRAVYCDVGTKVTAGQICAEIDPQPYRAAVEQAKADLAVADARLETARAALARMEKRIERQRAEADHGALSKKTLAQSEGALSRARARTDQEEASRALRRALLSDVEERLAQTAVAVTVDGIVIAREAKVGLTIEARDTPAQLVTIATDLSVVEIVVTIDSSELRQPRIGNQVAFSVASLPGRAFSGIVEQVSRSTQDADHASTYRVVVEAFNPDLLLRPGMVATLMIDDFAAVMTPR